MYETLNQSVDQPEPYSFEKDPTAIEKRARELAQVNNYHSPDKLQAISRIPGAVLGYLTTVLPAAILEGHSAKGEITGYAIDKLMSHFPNRVLFHAKGIRIAILTDPNDVHAVMRHSQIFNVPPALRTITNTLSGVTPKNLQELQELIEISQFPVTIPVGDPKEQQVKRDYADILRSGVDVNPKHSEIYLKDMVTKGRIRISDIRTAMAREILEMQTAIGPSEISGGEVKRISKAIFDIVQGRIGGKLMDVLTVPDFNPQSELEILQGFSQEALEINAIYAKLQGLMDQKDLETSAAPMLFLLKYKLDNTESTLGSGFNNPRLKATFFSTWEAAVGNITSAMQNVLNIIGTKLEVQAKLSNLFQLNGDNPEIFDQMVEDIANQGLSEYPPVPRLFRYSTLDDGEPTLMLLGTRPLVKLYPAAAWSARTAKACLGQAESYGIIKKYTRLLFQHMSENNLILKSEPKDALLGTTGRIRSGKHFLIPRR